RFLEKDPEAGSSGVWVKTLGTIGATQVLYMLPAYWVAKSKRQPRAYRTGLLLSAIGLFVLNVLLLYFFWE
ncbi:MAG: hypothetical protein P1V35_02125, partial [Planctomycetota bacterium]|nr:hypothetical protein [Planctomycetota bacterium]